MVLMISITAPVEPLQRPANGHTVPLKSKLPPSCETRLARETRLVSLETRLVSRECTGSTNTSHSSVFETCFVYKTSVSYHID